LRDGFIIRETLIEDNVLFISGDSSVGNTKPFISYDGTKVQVLSEDLDIDLKKTVQFKDKDGINNIVTVAKKGSTGYFLVLRNSIKEPTEYTIYDLFAPTSIFNLPV